MVTAVIAAFLLAALSAKLLVLFSRIHIDFSGDQRTQEPQKFHSGVIPRIGGLAIVAGAVLGMAILQSFGILKNNEPVLVIASMFPVFVSGFAEDVTKRIGPELRLIGSFVAAILAFYLLGAEIRRLDVPVVDEFLQLTPLSLLISFICIGGVAHAFNIIDGCNGLAAGVGIIVLSGLGFVGYQVHDLFIAGLCAVSGGALFGFFICNFPSGAIFAGDGGAYLIGFLIAVASVLLIGRHPGVSSWCPMLLSIYPVWETLFSIYRRKLLRGKSPHMPDALHLHTLIYKRWVRHGSGAPCSHSIARRNSRTSPYLWALTAIFALPAILFWNNTPVLMGFCVAFVLSYCKLYRSIVRFRSPDCMISRLQSQASRLPIVRLYANNPQDTSVAAVVPPKASSRVTRRYP